MAGIGILRSACLAAAVVLISGSAGAATTAATLRADCTAELKTSGDAQQQALSGAETSWKLGHCSGYIAGFMDADQNVRDGVTVKQVEDAFLQYLRANPADGEKTASWVLEASVRSAGLTYK